MHDFVERLSRESILTEDFFLNHPQKELLVRTCIGLEKVSGKSSRSLITKTINLMKDVHSYTDKTSDLKNILQPYKLKSRLDKEIVHYSLVHFKNRYMGSEGYDSFYTGYIDKEKQEVCPVYYDAPIAFGVKCGLKPLFVTSFFPSDSQTLLIQQFQGINSLVLSFETKSSKTAYYKDGFMIKGQVPNHQLNLFRWKDFSVDLINHFGKKHGFSQLAILGAENNLWTYPGDGVDAVLDKTHAKRIYDDYALSIGCVEKNDGNFYKPII